MSVPVGAGLAWFIMIVVAMQLFIFYKLTGFVKEPKPGDPECIDYLLYYIQISGRYVE
jgi:hypothetical protein